MSSSINIPTSSSIPVRTGGHYNSSESRVSNCDMRSSQSNTESYNGYSPFSSSISSSVASSVPNHSEDASSPFSHSKGKGKARATGDSPVLDSASPTSRRYSEVPGDVSGLLRNSQPWWARTSDSPSSSSTRPQGHARRPSMLADSFLEVDHRVVDVSCNGRMSLITCVKASQGWDWNQDIFLPSYLCDFDPMELELRQDPVADIVLTDEEMAGMLPS